MENPKESSVNMNEKTKEKQLPRRILQYICGLVCMAIGLVLPFFIGQIPAVGKMLLPMHIPVLLCCLICGWQWG